MTKKKKDNQDELCEPVAKYHSKWQPGLLGVSWTQYILLNSPEERQFMDKKENRRKIWGVSNEWYEPFVALKRKQLAVLLSLLNKYCFVAPLNDIELSEVFGGKRAVTVKNWGLLVYIFDGLSLIGKAAGYWKALAEQNKMFQSANGTPCRAKQMAKYLSRIKEQIADYKMYDKHSLPPSYKKRLAIIDDIDRHLKAL